METPKWIAQVNYMLCIDVGYTGLGYAVFPYRYMTKKPEVSGVIKFNKDQSITDKCEKAKTILMLTVKPIIQDEFNSALGMVIEYPARWGGSLLSDVASKRGELIMLGYQAGYLSTMVPADHVSLVTPQEWKGQLPKDIVIKRILKIFPKLKHVNDHEADAIGMAAAVYGLL
jgi:hypothetical protein